MKGYLMIMVIICLNKSIQSRDISNGFSSLVKKVPYVGETVDESYVRPIKTFVSDMGSGMQDVSDRFKKEASKDHISFFVQRLESFLKKLIPNKEAVQDLMGMPDPGSVASNEISREVVSILRDPAYKQKLSQRLTLERPPALSPPPARATPSRTSLSEKRFPSENSMRSHFMSKQSLSRPLSESRLLQQQRLNHAKPYNTQDRQTQPTKPLMNYRTLGKSGNQQMVYENKLPFKLQNLAHEWFQKHNQF